MKAILPLVALLALASIGSASDCPQPLRRAAVVEYYVEPIVEVRTIRKVQLQVRDYEYEQLQLQLQRERLARQKAQTLRIEFERQRFAPARPIMQRSFSFQRTVIR